jgi:nucleotide-binding universal stress UspA family protein
VPKPILVGYDPSSPDHAPVEFGTAAARFTGAPLIVASVHGSSAALGPAGSALAEEQLADDAAEPLDHLRRRLSGEGVTAEYRALPGTSAPRALHNAAEEFDAGLLVVGSTDRGAVGRVLLGSTAQRLVHGSPCPIAVVPHGWQAGRGINTIGVAFVDTPEGHDALKGAVALARRAGALLRVLSAGKEKGLGKTFGGGDAMTQAVTYADVASADRVGAEHSAEAAVAGASDIEIDYDVSVGDPADFLVAASERLDLLICGSRGYGPARSVMLGGVSRRVTTEAHCPVIVLARGTEAGLEALIDEPAGTAG